MFFDLLVTESKTTDETVRSGPGRNTTVTNNFTAKLEKTLLDNASAKAVAQQAEQTFNRELVAAAAALDFSSDPNTNIIGRKTP